MNHNNYVENIQLPGIDTFYIHIHILSCVWWGRIFFLFFKSLIPLWNRQVLIICASFEMLPSLRRLYLGEGMFSPLGGSCWDFGGFLSSWVRVYAESSCGLWAFVLLFVAHLCSAFWEVPSWLLRTEAPDNSQSKMKECGTESGTGQPWMRMEGLGALRGSQLCHAHNLPHKENPNSGQCWQTRIPQQNLLQADWSRIGECCANNSFLSFMFL